MRKRSFIFVVLGMAALVGCFRLLVGGAQFVDTRPEPDGLIHMGASPRGTSHKNSRIIYVGKFGMGHRLSKMAAAYLLAHRLSQATSLPLVLEAQWGICRAERDKEMGQPIFDYLFGDNSIPLRRTATKGGAGIMAPAREIWIRNDCPGYYAGQNFKNARQPIPKDYLEDNGKSPFFQKLDSDADFFQWLQDGFEQIHPDARMFREQHRFADHTVVGLHIRAGNGEQDNFLQQNREVGNEDQFLTNLMALLQQFMVAWMQRQEGQGPTSKQLLLFLATDTPTVIPLVKLAAQTWKVPVVTFPQPQLQANEGVTYSQARVGKQCLEAWKAMFVDTVLLGHADVLIAGMRSSFTQNMPMTMVFHRTAAKNSQAAAGADPRLAPRYCEVSESGRAMTCVESRQAWLHRNATNEWTLTVDGVASSSTSSRVVHKIVVHLPDVEDDVAFQKDWETALSFLGRSDDPVSSWIWGNGNTINTKYRRRNKGRGFTTEWTML